jgi:hypothetical protein
VPVGDDAQLARDVGQLDTVDGDLAQPEELLDPDGVRGRCRGQP